MNIRNLRIGLKLAIGFGAMLVLIVLASGAGFNGLTNVSDSLHVVGRQEVPILQVTKDMEASLTGAKEAVLRYVNASIVLVRNDEDRLKAARAEYERQAAAFDVMAAAVAEGGKLPDGRVVPKTDNPELARLVEEVDVLHDERYEASAQAVIESRREAFDRRRAADQSMTNVKAVAAEMDAQTEAFETLVRQRLQRQSAAADDVSELQDVLSRDVPLADAAMETKFLTIGMRIALEQVFQQSTVADLEEYLAIYNRRHDRLARILDAVLNGGEVDGRTVEAVDDPRLIEGAQRVQAGFNDLSAAADNLVQRQRDVIAAVQQADVAMAAMVKAEEEAGELLGQVLELSKAEMNAAISDGDAASSTASMVLLGVSAVSVVLGVIMGVLIARSITRPLSEAVKVTERIAEGDLTVDIQVDSKDETGQLLAGMRRMRDKLSSIVGDVRESTGIVSSAATEVAQGSTDLSQRTEEQASSLEETASSMEQMTATVKQNAEHAAQADQLSSGAREKAERGGEVARQMVSAMADISQSSKRIADIIGVIDEIAFQTNLLALNAAVEAARAGEQGRGFAVVAGEVRKLAQRSSDSAKEIRELILSSAAKVEDGGKLVEQSGANLEEIVTAVKKVSDIVAEISAASQEQSSGIDQVNKAVMQMDEVTQQNAALVEETAASSESMRDQADRLVELISFFKLATGGAAAQPTARAEARSAAPKAAASGAKAGTARNPAPKPAARPQAAKASAAASRPTEPAPAKAGADDEWEEF